MPGLLRIWAHMVGSQLLEARCHIGMLALPGTGPWDTVTQCRMVYRFWTAFILSP